MHRFRLKTQGCRLNNNDGGSTALFCFVYLINVDEEYDHDKSLRNIGLLFMFKQRFVCEIFSSLGELI